jgi:putative acetyltransferase
MSLAVVVPSSEEQLDAVRALMRSFVAWHRRRHTQDIHLIDAYFDAAAFDAELDGLPGAYVPPRGQLLLATSGGIAAGCVALREVDAASCEMKRMFVYEQFHGQGVGRALATAIIEQARSLGYRKMLLDTSIRQDEAQRLYAKLGFKVVQPYYELPKDMKDWLVFMELKLQRAAS